MKNELKSIFKYLLDFSKHPEQYNDDMVALLKVEQVIELLNYIDILNNQLQQKENIIKEVRESAKRELKIAEENIKNSEQWLDVEEGQEHAKRDIHTGKIVKRYMEMFLEILDKKEVN